MIEAKIEDFTFKIAKKENGDILIDDHPFPITFHQQSKEYWHISQESHLHKVFIQEIDWQDKIMIAVVNGKKVQVQLKGRAEQLIDQLGLRAAFSNKVEEVRAPMPGLIHAVMTKPGTEVAAGDPLIILEAMKMENVIKAPADGVVAKVHVAEKASVTKNALLISFE